MKHESGWSIFFVFSEDITDLMDSVGICFHLWLNKLKIKEHTDKDYRRICHCTKLIPSIIYWVNAYLEDQLNQTLWIQKSKAVVEFSLF